MWSKDEINDIVTVKDDRPVIEEGEYGNHPSKNGLCPKDAVVLFLITNYKVTEKNFPGYFVYSYGINDIFDRIAFLQDKGMLRVGTKAEDIEKMTVPKLKEIAKKYGLKTSGKKADILERITDTLTETQIEMEDIDVYWKLTTTGEREKNETKYLEYYYEHSADLEELYININDLNEAQYKNPSINFDDYRSQKIDECEKECLQARKAKVSCKYNHAAILKVKSHYLSDQNKYQEAIYWYAKYVYYMCNVYHCTQYKKWKEYHEIKRDDLFLMGEYFTDDLNSYQTDAQLDNDAFYSIVKKAFDDVDVKGQTDCVTFFEIFKYDYEGDKEGLISYLEKHF